MKAEEVRKARASFVRNEQRANLQAVIEMLRTVPDEQFNMEHWWLEDGEAWDEDRNVTYKVADGPCGCAIGHLIQRGLLSGEVLKPKNLPPGSLPYQYHDRVFVQIADALKLYNSKLAEFLFSQYSYINRGAIRSGDVIRRIEFVLSELKDRE